VLVAGVSLGFSVVVVVVVGVDFSIVKVLSGGGSG
jgi:hypothetical protein